MFLEATPHFSSMNSIQSSTFNLADIGGKFFETVRTFCVFAYGNFDYLIHLGATKCILGNHLDREVSSSKLLYTSLGISLTIL